MIPIPPARAIAIAIEDSVTVSIFALTKGMLIEIFRDNLVLRSVWLLLVISEYLGTRRTSSKVKPSLNSNETLLRKSNNDYKPLYHFESFEAIVIASLVASTL